MKEARESKKLSQSQVAERVGISKTALSGYEKNTKIPGSDKLKKLALLYGVSTDFLLDITHDSVFDLDGLTSEQRVFIEKWVIEIKAVLLLANRSELD